MPENSLPDGLVTSEELSKDDILDNLMQEDSTPETESEAEVEEKEEKEEEKPEEESEEEKEEEKEEEIELEEKEEEKEPTEEDLELIIPVKRREILAKYPNIFKDFPYLERAYYREQQYTEILPTIDDAKLAVEKAQVLDRFEQDVLQGNTENVLRAVKAGGDPESFKKLVDNYLPNLQKVDEQAYMHVVGNTLRTAINHMAREGQKLGENGEPLKIAAQLLNQYLFGTVEISEPRNLAKDVPSDESKRLQEEKRAFVRERFETASRDLTTKVQNVIKSTINTHIDPKQSMTDYVRRNASKDAYESLEGLMSQDTRFRVVLNKLWEKAFEENFSPKSLERIRSAYLSKAKTVLPQVIKKSRQDALKGLGRSTNSKEETKDRKGPLPIGRTSSEQSARSVKEIPRGMKTIDFLMQD